VTKVEKPRLAAPGAIDVFSPEEVHALVRAAASEQDAAIFLTAAFTGLRQGELVALRWRDVDFGGSYIRVTASYTNGELSTLRYLHYAPRHDDAAIIGRAFATDRVTARTSRASR
jgi:integrase